MFRKNINILGHCVYSKTKNNFDLIVTFPNDQSEADKIHKYYQNTLEVVFNFLFYLAFVPMFLCTETERLIEQEIHNHTCYFFPNHWETWSTLGSQKEKTVPVLVF